MSETSPTAREHFIPFTRTDIVAACLQDGAWTAAEREQLTGLCAILASTFHFEFHARLEELKALYAPFDPDADTRASGRGAAGGTAQRAAGGAAADPVARRERLSAAFATLLERGNYRRLTPAELDRALTEESDFGVRVFTDLADFGELAFFVRGRRTEGVPRRRLLRKPVTVTVDAYERVVLFARFRDAPPAAAAGGKPPKVPPWVPGSTILKLFRHVPCADLEMLLPNVDVRMRPLDRAMLGVPAVLGGLVVLLTKLSASLLFLFALGAFWLGFRKERVEVSTEHLVALGLGFFALAVHFFKSFTNYKNRRIKFMKALSESLYFRNLDNNAGVFHRLVDEAEEEETKEAVLAYCFLLLAQREGAPAGFAPDAHAPGVGGTRDAREVRGAGLTEAELDARVEAWFAERHGVQLDFEVDDALAKLVRLGLVTAGAGGRLRCVEIAEAQRLLDERWDNYFTYANG
ncbi:MAG TPA: TMEM143 family protein [Planctomycetota bacterium]|nr:TMEM143 family protein [Planctomycetota bacterium]